MKVTEKDFWSIFLFCWIFATSNYTFDAIFMLALVLKLICKFYDWIRYLCCKNSAIWSNAFFLDLPTLFENYSKCCIWILAFSTNFCPIKSDLSGNTIWKVKFLSKNSILTKLYNFLGKSKLSTAEKYKTAAFSRVFT